MGMGRGILSSGLKLIFRVGTGLDDGFGVDDGVAEGAFVGFGTVAESVAGVICSVPRTALSVLSVEALEFLSVWRVPK